MISLGIIGEYLQRIFLEVKGRPTFLIGSIVEHRENANEPDGQLENQTLSSSERV